MKIENNIIIECTEDELWNYWYLYWSDLLDYDTYRRKCENNGTKVKENEND